MYELDALINWDWKPIGQADSLEGICDILDNLNQEYDQMRVLGNDSVLSFIHGTRYIAFFENYWCEMHKAQTSKEKADVKREFYANPKIKYNNVVSFDERNSKPVQLENVEVSTKIYYQNENENIVKLSIEEEIDVEYESPEKKLTKHRVGNE